MSAINFPLTTTSLFVNTLTTNKIIYLPAASTIGAGRLFYIKDICGNAATSSIYISTTGMDRIENRYNPSTLYAPMSTNYGSILMAPDGYLNWYFLQHYYKNAVSSLGSAAVVATGAFSPTSIATLVQWLDANDNTTVLTGVGGTIVANGGSAGYWGDKSGNGNYVTTNTVAPVYSTSLISNRGGLNFQSSAGMISTAFAKASSITFFLVGTVKSTRASWGTFWGHFNSGRHDADIQLRYTDGTTHINWHTNNNNSSTQLPYTLDSPVIYSCTMTGGTVMFMQQTNTSGTTSLTVTEGTLTWASGTAPVWIGRSDSNECINSYISEIAYFQSVLSTADRQKMEGYLAWKWGLQTYLPSGHPYLSAPPGPLLTTALSYLPLSTNSTDIGSSPQTITTNGTVTYTTIGGKQAAYFSNSFSNYLSFPYTNQTNFTLVFWLYPIDTGYYTAVSISESTLTNPALQTDVTGSSTTIYTAMPSQWTNTPTGTTSGSAAWTHFAITVNQTTYVEQLYLNGSLATTATGSGSTISSRTLFVLGRSGDAGRAYYGYIRQFAFFNRVLSSTEISGLYTSSA